MSSLSAAQRISMSNPSSTTPDSIESMAQKEAVKLPPKSAFSNLSSSVDDYMARYLSGTPQPGETPLRKPRTKGR